MTKKDVVDSAAQKAEHEQVLAEITSELKASLGTARAVAEKVFGASPSEEMLLGCLDRVFCYDEKEPQEQVIAELLDCVGVAKKVSPGSPPTARMVFWIYDQVFDEADDEDEEDDEDDDEEEE